MSAKITTRTIDANGLSFVVDEAGEGDAVALLLHGFPESRISWRHQLPVLAAQGWRAIAPDLRGFGHSSRPPRARDYRLEVLTADVAGLFEAVGAKRRLLIGHDWGGAVAWTCAALRCAPLDGLVVMNCPHPAAMMRAVRTSWDQRRRSWYMAFFKLPWLPEALIRANGARAIERLFADQPADVREIYRRNALIPGAMTTMLNYYRANFGRDPFAGAAPVIKTPTLLIWGDADRYVGPKAMREGYDALVDDLTLSRLAGVSHWVQQAAPEAVNRVLLDWLELRHIKVNLD